MAVPMIHAISAVTTIANSITNAGSTRSKSMGGDWARLAKMIAGRAKSVVSRAKTSPC
jgi:hypothetical protein